MTDDQDEPILDPQSRYHLVALVVILSLIAAVAFLPRRLSHVPPVPPQAESGPWRVEADHETSPVVSEPSPSPMSPRAAEPTDDRRGRVDSLAAALSARLRLPNGRAWVRHCRRASGGCEARLALFAAYFVEAGDDHGIDPWLLAAIAVRESGLAPQAVSSIGARGIMQLHPRGVGRTVPFVRSPRARARCLRETGACQRAVVDVGTMHLARWVTTCGELERALSGYASGRCDGAPAYARRVLRELARLRSY